VLELTLLVCVESEVTALKLKSGTLEPQSNDGSTLQETVVGARPLKSESLAEVRKAPCA
jgi:hypothetical protein